MGCFQSKSRARLPFPVVDMSSLQAGDLRSLDGLQACILSCPRHWAGVCHWFSNQENDSFPFPRGGRAVCPPVNMLTWSLYWSHWGDMPTIHSLIHSYCLAHPGQSSRGQWVHSVTLSPVTGRRPGAKKHLPTPFEKKFSGLCISVFSTGKRAGRKH